MSSNNSKNNIFINSSRLKLTLIFSSIVFTFAMIILVLMNLYLTQSLRIEPQNLPEQSVLGRPLPVGMGPLNAEQRERVRQIRLNDLQNFQEISFLSIVPITLLSFAIGYFLSGQIFNPIIDLSKKVRKFKSNQLGMRIETNRKDEIGELVESFNTMSERLRKSFDAQQKFVQDAAHELKTPITIIKTSLETTIQDKSAKKEELVEAIQDSIEGVNRLSKLTTDLLDLTRPFETNEKVNIINLIQQQVKLLEQYAQQNSTKIEIVNADNVSNFEISGNNFQLGRAFFNIIHNAIKYSKHNSESYLKIIFSDSENGLIIKFEDNGIGIKSEDRNKIFDRFYRGVKQSDGNGLGLAITREIIEAHGGRIEILNYENGSTFEVALKINL